MKKFFATVVLAGAFAAQAQAPAPSAAPVAVQGAWARAVLQGQSTSGGYMTLTAAEPLTLVAASSPAAGIVEIHEMRMDGDVMRMRALDSLALPAGKAVELRPGGYHLMLMDLKAALRAGMNIPVKLQLRDARGQPRVLEVSVPVLNAPPAPHKH